MTRLPVAAFAALVAATVAAFFVTQHLKVSTPLIAGTPSPLPAWINPVSTNRCWIGTPAGKRLTSFNQMKISFYLLHRSDHVDVYVVDSSGATVRTLASDRYMQGGAHPVRSLFTWDGREANGKVAPDGSYYIRVALLAQGRTVDITDPSGQAEPVMVKTVPPHPMITSVTPRAISAPASVAIHYQGTENNAARIFLYRPRGSGKPRLVKSFGTPAGFSQAVWDGRIHERPASPGRYLIGLEVTDQACNTGYFPSPGTVSPVSVRVR